MTLADRIVEALMYAQQDTSIEGSAEDIRAIVKRVIAETPPGLPKVTPDDHAAAAGFYRACSHTYFNPCVDCSALRVAAIREKAQAETHEPGKLIAGVTCPCCGASLRVEHGDDPGEIGVIGTAAETPPQEGAAGRLEACMTTGEYGPDPLHSLYGDLRAVLNALEEAGMALADLTSEPGDLVYPRHDVYASGDEKEDATAPLWTEAGLYGRVGKDAARTLLHRHRRAVEALTALRKVGVNRA